MPKNIYQGGPDKFTLAPAHSTLLAALLYSLHVKNSSLWKVQRLKKNNLPGECAEIVQIGLQFGLHSFSHCHF